jgi:hypothetical protein
MIYYYAVTKTTAKQTISEIANYGKSTSIGQALIDLQPVGFVTFFLEITEEDYNLLIRYLKELKTH